MSIFSRRIFLSTSFTAGAALAMQRIVARGELFKTHSFSELIATRGAGAYGALTPTPAKNTGEMLLALPEGFQYTVLGKTGEKLSDGHPTPRNHDGMAAFKVKDELRLIRNHEINNGIGSPGQTIGDPTKSYDPLAGGGTTTLVIDPKTREVKRHFVSLSGSLHNCAGGPTPWGSWITCEETILGPIKFKDTQGRDRGGFGKNHGYCFEVPAAYDELKIAAPLTAMGRFVHEAIAVDPRTGIVYETEDRGNAGFYRFVPNRRGKLAEGGRLQMLAIKNQPKFDTRQNQKPGAQYAAGWVDIDDPDPADFQTNESTIYTQGLNKGGATFARLEGCWSGAGSIFFTSTSGGNLRRGQVWRYTPKGKDDGALTLLFESPDAALLDGPDNLCVSPRGGLVICEDGRDEQFIRGLTPEGKIFDLVRNHIPGFENKEFAGATFSPDGQTLFFNAQSPGLTFALWGPWSNGAL
jgi:secreted PhoX family phosphatase